MAFRNVTDDMTRMIRFRIIENNPNLKKALTLNYHYIKVRVAVQGFQDL